MSRSRNLSFYINQLTCRPEYLGEIRDAGFSSVCWVDSLEWFEMDLPHRRRKLAEARQLVESHGLAPLDYHLGTTGLIKQGDEVIATDVLAQRVEELQGFGIVNLVVHLRSVFGVEDADLLPYLDERGPAWLDDLLVEPLRAAADLAGQYNMRIALENIPHPHRRSVRDILEVIALADRSNIGICLDTGHTHICGFDLADEVRRAGDRLFTLHVHDNLGLRDRHLMAGLGTIDWPGFDAALDDVRYQSPIPFEGIRGIDDDHRLLHTAVIVWRAMERIDADR